MLDQLKQLETESLSIFAATQSLSDLEAARVAFLGRKGRLAEIMSQLPTLSHEEKRAAGQMANEVKAAIEGAFAAAQSRIESAFAELNAERAWIDTTLPGEEPGLGHVHLTTQAISDIMEIFSKLGFNRQRHPDLDWDYYAFESLNMPKEHPARDEWETFFIAAPDKDEVQTGELGKVVLTPHTSNAQVREMQKGQLPIRMINIGKTYRRQATARHLPMFHQFEGLMIDENVSITDLRGVFDFFVKRFFGEGTKTRLRPFHFRFTEPSFELDISCTVCDGEGFVNGVKCKLCKGGWLELGGAGMVHPNVLKAGGIDPKKYTGFAFGWGVERTAMMRGGLKMDDIRLMYRNDLRFLKQF
ncbi:MAG TPA: phenylalanine--tRNA ligase subunit alpha [bacterium]|nr:phenylalanine--tRNA ligase subunit alpha [bacterium]